jgi:hypothetical protein
MQRLFAIAWLTWKAAFRFRLFLVVAVLLLASVIALPLLIKDDGTARGFTQILLTYTLSTIAALLGLSTLWLACGTLARDIEDCQIQVVATKPIARWQIWLGKWLGIMSLNAALLALSGACVYGLLQWRATKLPADQQAILRSEVLVSRGSTKERSFDAEIEKEAERVLQERLKQARVAANDIPEFKRQVHEQIKAGFQAVPPGAIRPWEIDLSSVKSAVRTQPLFIRIKFLTPPDASTLATYATMWQIGAPDSPRQWQTNFLSMAPETFHEFQIPPNLIDDKGQLVILFRNPNTTTLLFQLEDGMEVLYREGGFALNFARGLGIIFCWMALLAALGLASATFLSFPVAAFVALSVLIVTFSSTTLSTAVSEGSLFGYNEEQNTTVRTHADTVIIPLFKAMLTVINLVRNFSPIDSLSTGRSITWGELGLAFGQIVVLLGGLLGLIGIAIFSRRELATAQGTQ